MASRPANETPSPRWPTGSMRSFSTTSRAEEEFAVAVTALDRRWEHLDVGAAELFRERRDLVADLLVHGGVADDAALAVFALRLELRLDQRQQMHRRGRER